MSKLFINSPLQNPKQLVKTSKQTRLVSHCTDMCAPTCGTTCVFIGCPVATATPVTTATVVAVATAVVGRENNSPIRQRIMAFQQLEVHENCIVSTIIGI